MEILLCVPVADCRNGLNPTLSERSLLWLCCRWSRTSFATGGVVRRGADRGRPVRLPCRHPDRGGRGISSMEAIVHEMRGYRAQRMCPRRG